MVRVPARPHTKVLLVIVDDLDEVMRLRFDLDCAAPGVFDLVHEQNPADACGRLLVHEVDAVLMDLSRYNLRAIEAVLAVAGHAPLVVLTEADDAEVALAAVHAGAQECLVKGGESPRTLVRALRHAIERSSLRRELIEARSVETFRATHDALTGLANRGLFLDRLSLQLDQAEREQANVGVAFVDLNHFKAVNDRLGHAAGDLLLQHVANVLSECLRSGDTVARFGGDEFAILLHDVSAHEDVERILDTLRARVEAEAVPRILDGVRVSLSIGSAVYPQDGRTAEALIAMADAHMYVEKRLHHAHAAWEQSRGHMDDGGDHWADRRDGSARA